jgi:hypothetical protein
MINEVSSKWTYIVIGPNPFALCLLALTKPPLFREAELQIRKKAQPYCNIGNGHFNLLSQFMNCQIRRRDLLNAYFK